MNKIFVKTARNEHKGKKLTPDLKRMLSLMDGRSRSGDLAKHAPPSLRKRWNELLNELVEGGYIVESPETDHDRKTALRAVNTKDKSIPKPGIASSANDLDFRNMSAAERVVAELEAAAAAATVRSGVDAKADAKAKQKNDLSSPSIPAAAKIVAELEANAAAAKVKSDVDAKAEAEADKKAEKAARARELKAFFAAAKEKAKAEAKQMEQEAARAHAEREAAAAAAKVRSVAEAKAKAEAAEKDALDRAKLEAAGAAVKAKTVIEGKAKAEAKQMAEKAARDRVELETAILAAKVKSDIEAKARQEAQAGIPIAASVTKQLSGDTRTYKWRLKFGGMHASDSQRIRDLEIENDRLKKMLAEAYLKMEDLKASFGVKR